MPLFSYGIGIGCFYTIKNKTFNRYCTNILLLAILSQPIYHYFRLIQGYNSLHLNVCFSYFLSCIFIYMVNHYNEYTIFNKIVFIIYYITMVILSCIVIGTSYNILGIFLPIMFYLYYKKEDNKTFVNEFIIFSVLLFGYCFLNKDIKSGTGTFLYQMFSIFSLRLIPVLEKYDNKIKLPKYVKYSAYPVSMIVFIPFCT